MSIDPEISTSGRRARLPAGFAVCHTIFLQMIAVQFKTDLNSFNEIDICNLFFIYALEHLPFNLDHFPLPKHLRLACPNT